MSQRETDNSESFDDEPFDLEAVMNGAWLPSPYGPDDQRGTWNEVTPEKTASQFRREGGS